MATKKQKSSEEKLLLVLHGQLSSAYATGLFGVKGYEKKLVELTPGQVLGAKGQIIGERQAKLSRVCALIDAATVELEDLIELYEY